jgi:predicted glycosyltransferase
MMNFAPNIVVAFSLRRSRRQRAHFRVDGAANGPPRSAGFRRRRFADDDRHETVAPPRLLPLPLPLTKRIIPFLLLRQGKQFAGVPHPHMTAGGSLPKRLPRVVLKTLALMRALFGQARKTNVQSLRTASNQTGAAKVIWIDLDNSPHVPFFRPIIDELQLKGCTVKLTARNAFQVAELTKLHGIDCTMVGRHFGKNPLMKALGLVLRSIQLLPLVARHRPDLAVSHGSRAQTMVAKLLAIPSLVIVDYEHIRLVTKPDWIVVPEVIPAAAVAKYADHVLKYPGIKEDVYTSVFRPDAAFLQKLNLSADQVIVTVRPPATEAHYHNAESEELLVAAIELLTSSTRTRIIILPRNQRQKMEVVRQWRRWIESGKMIIPDQALDGLNLVWHSDLVISGGGTMNREAAALNVPVYSIFRGSIGAVDRYLADNARMVLLKSVEDVRRKIHIAKRDRTNEPAPEERSAREVIVDHIHSIASNSSVGNDTGR